MARPGLLDHPKFKRLCHILAMPEPHILGHLEFLWRVSYQCGDPVIGDKIDVELAAKWSGEPGKLFTALLECGGPGRAGFIEQVSGTSKKCPLFQVHDLWDHAPDYVRSRYRMEEYRKRNRSKNSENNSEQLRNGYGSPAPARAPAPNIPLPPEGGEGGFDQFWNAYPKKTKRRIAMRKWETLKPTTELIHAMLESIAKQIRSNPQWQRESGRYIPNPADWLDDHGWEWKPAGAKVETQEEILARYGKKP